MSKQVVAFFLSLFAVFPSWTCLLDAAYTVGAITSQRKPRFRSSGTTPVTLKERLHRAHIRLRSTAMARGKE